MPRLKQKYINEVIPKMKDTLGMTNRLRMPRLVKIVVNMGIAASKQDAISKLMGDLTKITGQKPVSNKARKSISNFKVREGMIVGAKVTLRGDRMYEFLDRLLSVALPRIRDFRGVSPTAFDGRGSYTLGVKEQTVFPEIDPNTVTVTQGMDITIVTTARNNDEAREMLKLLGMPFSGK
ncbi:MAG: 50S ribosomal protein L5 [Kiritimatiellae bacterium]|nr:50S ribosomal protein L5 [Kiritimatiellia bacterium]MDD5522240.1 50S ribosomal protein L5 [Kiritimatiellia bacterium]